VGKTDAKVTGAFIEQLKKHDGLLS